ncbi:MAG: hypothetical protein O7G83_12020 [Proteobacteria bacterium]|nr:hypothetical protein [Pseudomonadota bacterium]
MQKCAASLRYGGCAAELTDRLVAFADSLHDDDQPVSLRTLADS